MHGNDPQDVVRMCKETYGAAGIGSLNPGQVLHVRVEDVHLLHQAGQGGFSSLTDLLVDLLGLEEKDRCI